MYVIDIEALKQALRAGPLPQRQLLYYLVCFFGLDVVEAVPFDVNLYDHAQMGVTAVVTALGLWHCYRCNGGDAGRDFAGRFFSLGFVLGIRFLCAIVALALLMGLLLPFDVSAETTAAQFAVMSLVEVWFYMRLGDHVRALGDDVPDGATSVPTAIAGDG